jgi:hypothetical protein
MVEETEPVVRMKAQAADAASGPAADNDQAMLRTALPAATEEIRQAHLRRRIKHSRQRRILPTKVVTTSVAAT